MSLCQYQRGATLLVTMIMLVIFTLFVVTMIGASGVNLKIAGNMQSKQRVEADAQRAIEQVISDAENLDPPFNDGLPANQFPQTAMLNDSTVTTPPPTCLREVPVAGYAMGSATQPSLAPLDMVWEIQATAQDAMSGAVAVIHQGLRIRRPLGSLCP